MNDKLMDAREVGRRVGVRPATVLTWARRGLIPAVRAGQHPVRFVLEDVLAALRTSVRPGQEARRG